MEGIYLITDGVETELLQILALAESLEMPDTEESLDNLVKILNYLANENLIKVFRIHAGLPATIQITHKGVLEVEKALSDPKSETEHFAPNITITNNIGSMVNSSLQQATSNSQQSLTFLNGSDKSIFINYLSDLKKEVEKLSSKLNDEQNQDVAAELSTIDSQMQSSKPKKTIISSSLETLSDILKGAAGSGTWELITAMSAIVATIA